MENQQISYAFLYLQPKELNADFELFATADRAGMALATAPDQPDLVRMGPFDAVSGLALYTRNRTVKFFKG
jgi:hypothetical protein